MQKINSKRLLALILAIVMMVGVFPPIAMAGESFTETDPAWQGTPREINFTGREWAWSDAVGTNPGGTPATNQMDVGAGQIAGGGNGVNAFQIGAENARSRYFMYETREQAIEFFTLYPFGKGDDFEALFQDSPSSWILNLNSEDDWYFRFDRAPRYRPWPQSAVARPLPGQLNADGVTRSFDPGGDNPIFGTTVHNNFLFSGLVHGGNTAAAGASATGTNALTPDDGVTRSGRFPAGVYGFDVTETYTQTTGTAVTGLVPASALAAHGVTMPGALNHGNIPLRQTTQDGWHNITVPGMWHMNWNDDGTFMFDRIIYVNQPNPYTGQYGNPWASGIGTGNQYASGVLPAPPEVYNGVGTYQRDFVIGPEWADKRVFLNLDGADSFYVWVNGIPVGFSDDKFTHTEFDITDALRIRQDGSNEYGSVVGNHTITVQLIRWSTGSNFEIQDFVRISGIFRSIYLMARNMEDLWDFQVDTRPVNPTALRGASQDTDWTFHLRTLVRDFPNPLRDAGESRPVRFELLGPDGSVVASYNTANTVLRDEYGTGTPVAGSPANNTGTYRMHVTNLGRDSFLGVFGDGVRFNADAANRTALDPYTTRGPAATHPAVYGTIASAETNQTRVSLAKPAEFMATIPADEIQLWSPEAPNLYQLVVWVDNGEETMYTSIKVGFRYVELESAARYAAGNHQGRLFINGRLVTFRGTNVHEVNPWYGHTMPLGIIRRDLQLMRQHNMNGLRMAHYPHDARYYDLAAIYGLFIMDEANIEVHFSGHGSLGNITNRAFSGPLTRDRQLNMFERTKNFPSVVMWSNGNESGISAQTAGYTLQALEKREADITQRGRGRVPGIAHWSTAREANDRAGRPTHSEWGNPGRHLGQLWTQMYPEINAWSQHGGDGNPVINCELSHMMGNSGGNFDSWTWISESRNHDIGTFIWEFIDQAIYAPFRSSSLQVGGTTIEPFYQSPSETGRWDAPADPSELSWFFSVGGDWGDARTDGSFMACGLMGADRVPFPAASEVRRQYQNIRAFMTPAQEQAITAGSIDFTVLNRYMFTNANNFDMTWDITENGRIIRSGTDVLDVNPIPHGRGQNAGTGGSRFTRDMLTQEAVTITFDPILPLPNAEYHFNIRFHEREELPWMSIGGYLNDPDAVPWAIDDHCFVEDGPWAVSTSQIPITAAALRNPALPNPPMSVLEMTVSGDLEANNEGAITITGPDARFVYVFDKEEGVFTSMSYGGREFITSGPEPSFFRAVSCNELGIGGRNAAIQGWRNAATDRLRGATTTTVSQDGNVVTIVAQFMNPGRNMTSLNNRTVYTIFPDGEVNVEQTYQWGASVGVLPEIGTRMTLVPGLDNVTYFGRGPDENYTDRRWGNDVGVWETTVADMFTPYLTTQFMGNRIDTRWAALTDDDGFGIVVTAGDFGANNVYRGSAAAYNPNQIPRNADSMFEFYALYYTMQELDGPRPSTRHNRQPERMFHTLGRPNAAGANNPIYLNINLASWGVGGDQSWGADARGQYQINYANSTYTYNFNIRPVTNFNNFDHYASREVRNFRDNVSDLVPLAIAAGVPATHPAITAAINLPSNATDVAAANVYTALINVMADIRPVVNFATVAGVSAMPNTNNEIRLTVPEGVEIDALAPVFETVGTGGAAVTIYPTGPQDFTDGPVAFTLTVNGVTNTYLVFVEPFMAAKSITSFELAGQAGIITYDSDGNGHILVDLSARADNATLNLVPQISSTGVRIEPSQTVAQDFAAPVTYTVHARDGSYRTYTVTVLAFGGVTPFINTLTALDNYVGIIDHVNRNISVLLPFGSNPASVPVAITAHGIVTGPVPGTTEDDVHSFVIDATNPVTFTVTLDSVSRAYTVNVVVDPGLGTDIYTFAIDGNAGVIDLNARTIAVTVPIGTELGGVTPEMTLSIGATVHAPTLPVNFVPGEPMEFTVRSASGTVEDIWTVSVMVSRDVEGIDPAQFLDPRATGLVFATDTTLGISVLPETVDLLVSAGVGNPPVSVEADVTWTSPPPLARYQTITVHGAAVIPGAPGIAPSDPFPISAQLEVLPPDTVVWISAGMGERPHLNAPAASLIGSVFFDAVEEFLGDQLLNNVPSRPSPNATGNEPGAEWGAKAGEGGTGTAPANNAAVRNRIFHIQGPGARNYMDLRTQRGYYTGAPVTGSGGGNQPGNRVEYRLPLLQPGMYTIAIGTTEFWSGPRNARVDIMTGTGTNPANFATDPNVIASGPISVSGGGNTARLVLQFVLTEETTPIVRMTTTSSDDPILTYLIVSADDARIPLRETIEEAEAVNQSLFTPESVEAMDQALQAAQLVYGNPEASQAAMIEATANLRAAIDALVPMLPSLTAIHPDELVSHGANRATAPFFATTPELGIEGLPETIRMRNDHHDTENEAAYVVADVTWTAPAGGFPLHATVLNVAGVATAPNHMAPFNLTATVEVVDPNTVVWINAGTGESGSALFEAVRRFLPDGQLRNDASCQQGDPLTGNPAGAIWGHKRGEGSTVANQNRSTTVRTEGGFAGAKIQSGIYTHSHPDGPPNTGNVGNNAVGNRIEYRLPQLNAGTYTFTIHAQDWWAEWYAAANARRIQVQVLTATGETALENVQILHTTPTTVVPGSGPGGGGPQTSGTITGTFTLDEAAMPILRFLNDGVAGAQRDPVFSWIQVVEVVEEPTGPQLLTFNIPGYGIHDGAVIDSVNRTALFEIPAGQGHNWQQVPFSILVSPGARLIEPYPAAFQGDPSIGPDGTTYNFNDTWFDDVPGSTIMRAIHLAYGTGAGQITVVYTVTVTLTEPTIPPHTISWALVGGAWSGEFTPPATVADGGTIAAIAEANLPTRDGFTFTGWAPELPLEDVTGPVTVTAQWDRDGDGMTLVLETVTAAPGESVEVSLSVENNVGLSTADIHIEFADDDIELVGRRRGLFAAPTFAGGPNHFPLIHLPSSITDSMNVEDNGALITLLFDVCPDATEGFVPIEFYSVVAYSVVGVTTVRLEDIILVDGRIYIAEPPAPVVESITVTTQPTMLVYTEDETLDLDGLVVTLTYDDGTTRTVAFADFAANGLTASPGAGTVLALTHNGTPVTITHTTGATAATDNLTVTALEPEVVSIAVTTQPTRLVYTERSAVEPWRNTLDLDGLVVTLTYNDGSSRAVAFTDFAANGLTTNPADGTALALTHNDTVVTITHTESGETATTAALTVTAIRWGDVNNDNAVTLGDVSMLNLYVLGFPVLDTWMYRGDVNHDGDVTLGDVSLLNLYVLGFPVRITPLEATAAAALAPLAADDREVVVTATVRDETPVVPGAEILVDFALTETPEYGIGLLQMELTTEDLTILGTDWATDSLMPRVGPAPPVVDEGGRVTFGFRPAIGEDGIENVTDTGHLVTVRFLVPADVTIGEELNFDVRFVESGCYATGELPGLLPAVVPAVLDGGAVAVDADDAGDNTQPEADVDEEIVDSAREFHLAYMLGNTAGEFEPTANITRAQVAAILARTMLEDFTADALPEDMDSFDAFSDVASSNWFYYYVAWAYEAGLVEGDGRGNFLPNDPITREQLAAMLARTGVYATEAGEMPFLDVDAISGWAAHLVYTTFTEGWMVGDTQGDFRPRANISRAEVATAVNRILGRIDSRAALEALEELDIADARNFPDVADDAWYFASVLGATNDHYLTRGGESISGKAIVG